MPHLILEYSDNIEFQPDVTALLQKIHLDLAAELPTDLSSCKSRCIAHKEYYIGDGSKENSFVHLTIKVLAGRTDEKKQFIARKIHALLKDNFKNDKNAISLQLSVEILDLDKNYFKG